jgi:hypothetical protein
MKGSLRTFLSLFAVMTFVMAFAFSGQVAAQPLMPKLTPRYAERVLSEYLEEIAVESLGNILPKDSFEILVDIKVEDAEELEKIKDLASQGPLPGLTSPQSPFTRKELLGFLESLGQKKNILVVIDPDDLPSGEKKEKLLELVQETLTGKLKLNIASQRDVIVIREARIMPSQDARAERSIASDKGRTVRVTESHSGTDFSFFWNFFLTLVVLAAVYYGYRYWKTKRSVSFSHGEEKTSIEDFKGAGPSASLVYGFGDEPEKPETPAKGSEELISLFEKLAVDYPGLSSQALQKYVQLYGEDLRSVVHFVELVGFDRALKLFSDVPQKTWRIIGQFMAANPLGPDDFIDYKEVLTLYRILMAFVVENKGFDSDMGVFAKLEGFSPVDLHMALQEESDVFIAKFLSGVSESTSSDIVGQFESSRKIKILATMAKVRNVTSDELATIESKLSKKLGGDSGTRLVEVTNDARIFRSLAQMSPVQEEQLFADMLDSDPDLEARAHRHRFYPVHLANIDATILKEELRTFPVDDIAKMLRGIHPTIEKRILSLTPERKAIVIQDSLDALRTQPIVPEYAEVRRYFLDTLFEKYVGTNQDFAGNLFSGSSGGGYNAA